MTKPQTKRQQPKFKSEPAVYARVVVTQSVTHIPTKGDPTVVQVGVARFLTSQDSPYMRPAGSLVITNKWTKIDLGWLAEDTINVSEIVLLNTEGTGLTVIPTQEERDDIARRILEVGTLRGDTPPESGDWEIHPGDSFRGRPVSVENIVVRARNQEHRVRCDLLVIPK